MFVDNRIRTLQVGLRREGETHEHPSGISELSTHLVDLTWGATFRSPKWKRIILNPLGGVCVGPVIQLCSLSTDLVGTFEFSVGAFLSRKSSPRVH